MKVVRSVANWCLRAEEGMVDMWFDMPVKVYQEKDCVLQHKEELAALGKKPLIVTGKNSARKTGALADVENALKSCGREYAVFDQVEENPSIETVMKARDYALAEQADCVIGIGGGSPLDAAKAISLMMKNADKGSELLYSGELAQALPVAAVPTTCGTGSEVTPYAILTIHEKRTKSSIPYRIYPRLALVDSRYLAYAGREIIANTAIDALAHLIESYCSLKATDYSRMACSYGLKVWSRNKEVISGKRKPSEEDLQNLLCASTLAGIGITHTGTALPHAASYKITYEKKIAHGKAAGSFLAAFLRRAGKKQQEEILSQLGMKSCEELHIFITEAVGKIEAEQMFAKEAAQQLLSNPGKLLTSPFPIDAACIEEIYKESCVLV